MWKHTTFPALILITAQTRLVGQSLPNDQHIERLEQVIAATYRTPAVRDFALEHCRRFRQGAPGERLDAVRVLLDLGNERVTEALCLDKSALAYVQRELDSRHLTVKDIAWLSRSALEWTHRAQEVLYGGERFSALAGAAAIFNERLCKVLKHDYTVPRTDVTGALEWQLRLLADSKDGFKDDPIATAVIESLRRDLATQLADRTKQQRRQE